MYDCKKGAVCVRGVWARRVRIWGRRRGRRKGNGGGAKGAQPREARTRTAVNSCISARKSRSHTDVLMERDRRVSEA